jgi:hypothetical protein
MISSVGYIIFHQIQCLETRLFTGMPPFEPSKYRKCQSGQGKRQFMPNVCALVANQCSNWSSIPSDFHSKSGTNKSKTKRPNRAPAERQQLLLIPRIKIVPA